MHAKNQLFIAIVLVLASTFFCSVSVKAEDNGNITIQVVGLRNNNGVVRIALFNTKETYDASKFSGDQSVKKVIVPIKGNEATETLKAIPYGEYAIKLFHDEDNSGRFITNAFGIPKVEYGFSNNAHGLFGPASFEKAKFKLDTKNLTMIIKMQ